MCAPWRAVGGLGCVVWPDVGTALIMAGQLATVQGIEQLLASAAAMREADPGSATEVAGLLTQMVAALPDGTLPASELADLVAALGGA